MQAARQILGRSGRILPEKAKKGSPYKGPSLFPSLKNFIFTLFHIPLV
jgi:hypothetical protein